MSDMSLYSSRRVPNGQSLGSTFLAPQLAGASSYKRIAGYFCSSIIDIAGTELDQIVESKGCVQVVCNARLDFVEGETYSISEAALEEFLWAEWTTFKAERARSVDPKRFARLHRLMKDGHMEVRVLWDSAIGLLHGKAGLITVAGHTQGFLGSANESLGGWARNYELLAASDDAKLVEFIEQEFSALWAMSMPIPKRIVDDFDRLAKRQEITLDEWRQTKPTDPIPDPGPVLGSIASEEITPMEYQKWFIDMAFRDHMTYPWGARYVLADPVGLGKTIQLGMTMKLIALADKSAKPLLVIVPKTLVKQWQAELVRMGIPSAYWEGDKRQWVSEDESRTDRSPSRSGIPACPRLIGIVSSGLVSRMNPMREWLLKKEYSCVVVDEAHRARRHVVATSPYGKTRFGDQRNLLKFLREISKKTKSMLLGTATPIQIHPIEAWDLLSILSQGNNAVLGTDLSKWNSNPEQAINFFTNTGKTAAGSITTPEERWQWVSNPLPFPRLTSSGSVTESDQHIRSIRENLNGHKWSQPGQWAVGPSGDPATDPNLTGIQSPLNELWGKPNTKPAESILKRTPFARRVIRRSREELENRGALRRIEIDLRGDSSPLSCPAYMIEAFDIAQEFCKTLVDIPKGFMQTLLLRRVGSSKRAGLETAHRMLANWKLVVEDDEDDDGDSDMDDQPISTPVPTAKDAKVKTLTSEQSDLLHAFCDKILDTANDPKFEKLFTLLTKGETNHQDSQGRPVSDPRWIDDGVIVFSQYFETAEHFARMLSKALPNEKIALYAGSGRSMIFHDAENLAKEIDRDSIKMKAASGEIRVIFGTDAASEGLNLQMFSSLINLDLPWNPTRLEQRKGRIQRPGQKRDAIRVYNMRYEGSVEEKVHQLLTKRFKDINGLLGQIPDCLESIWILEAQGKADEAKKRLGEIPQQNPLQDLYDKEIMNETVNWDESGKVLNTKQLYEIFKTTWRSAQNST